MQNVSFFVYKEDKFIHILWVMCIKLWKPLQIAEYLLFLCG